MGEGAYLSGEGGLEVWRFLHSLTKKRHNFLSELS